MPSFSLTTSRCKQNIAESHLSRSESRVVVTESFVIESTPAPPLAVGAGPLVVSLTVTPAAGEPDLGRPLERSGQPPRMGRTAVAAAAITCRRS